jgi:hypothetical protein
MSTNLICFPKSAQPELSNKVPVPRHRLYVRELTSPKHVCHMTQTLRHFKVQYDLLHSTVAPQPVSPFK